MKKLIILILYLFLLLFSSLFRYQREVAVNRGEADATTRKSVPVMPDSLVY